MALETGKPFEYKSNNGTFSQKTRFWTFSFIIVYSMIFKVARMQKMVTFKIGRRALKGFFWV